MHRAVYPMKIATWSVSSGAIADRLTRLRVVSVRVSRLKQVIITTPWEDPTFLGGSDGQLALVWQIPKSTKL